MISRDELALLVSGAMHEACSAIEAVAGRRLTSTEASAMGAAFKTALIVACDRSSAKAPLPPPAPGPRPPRPFNPLATQELRAVPKDAK
jgi:hypothetical protein